MYTAPKSSQVDFSFSRSEPFYKTLNIEQKAIFGQKKLALNKTNKSLARVNIFCSTGTETILTANFRLINVLNLSLWTGALYSAYLSLVAIEEVP